MDRDQLMREIIEDTKALLRQAAHPRRQTLSLSPEVVALLENLSLQDAVASELAVLAEEARNCTRCSLSQTRKQAVFSDGDPHARVVFVGEAPGADEDQQGVPFVGAAGQLLTRIIEKAMGLKRREVYICNTLKCRPPGNRDPRADEKAECEHFLIRQIELVNPKVICALGGHAAKTLLKTEESTTRLRGKWHFFHGIPVRVTYHPSYLLHCKPDKEKYKTESWKVSDDVKAVMRVLKGEEDPHPPETGDTPLFG